MSSTLGLPQMTKELKPMEPFLKRAAELKDSEPVLAYWCAYYAAQLGISIKAKDMPSRNLLFDLLGSLEMTKKAIGPNEAMDIEAVSIAYVEDFALRVFEMADDEDRKGRANNGTAKKFLAASNFLEVLKVFVNSGGLSDDNQSKLRYAKWKAVEITKAIKEGRKPTPGGPGNPAEVSPTSKAFSLQPISDLEPTLTGPSFSPPEPPTLPAPSSSPPKPPHIKRISPPPHLPSSDIARANEPHTPPRHLNQNLFLLDAPDLAHGEATPGSWSTVATPGTAYADTPGDKFPSKPNWDESPMPKSKLGTGVIVSNAPLGESVFPRRPGSDGTASPTTPPADLAHDVALPALNVQNGDDGHPDTPGASKPHQYPAPLSPEECVDLPPGFVPTHIIPSPPLGRSPQQGYVSPPVAPPAPPPVVKYPTPPQPPPAQYAPPVPPPQPSRPVPAAAPVRLELTPMLVAKAQKHCRFAISALDYEDAEGAKKELRAALALLGE